MDEQYEGIYNEMLEAIEDCIKIDKTETAQITACFWAAQSYWNRMKDLIHPKDFKNEKEEIEFFRTIKPLFTSHIEYYLIRSEASVCIPTKPVEELNYWEEEKTRYMRFCKTNNDFINYYEGGSCYMDSVYFLRKNAGSMPVNKATVFDTDPEYCSSHDYLVRRYLAYKMYWEYCKGRIERLMNKKLV